MNQIDFDENNESIEFECVHSDRKLDIVFIRYYGTIGIVAWFFLMVLEVLGVIGETSSTIPQLPTKSFTSYLPFIIILVVLMRALFYKFAYNVQFYRDRIKFLQYFSKDNVEYNVSELDVIRIGWFYNFKFKNGEILRGLDFRIDDNIRYFKDAGFKVEWGWVGRLKFRKSIYLK